MYVIVKAEMAKRTIQFKDTADNAEYVVDVPSTAHVFWMDCQPGIQVEFSMNEKNELTRVRPIVRKNPIKAGIAKKVK